MPTPSPVESVLLLLRQSDGAELLDDSRFEEHLKITLRVTLQVGAVFETLGDDPVFTLLNDPTVHHSVDMVRDDIDAAVSLGSFKAIESTVTVIDHIAEVAWAWPRDLSWPSARSAFRMGIDALQDPKVTTKERYAQLLRLTRLQYVFYGMTIGLTGRGYVA